MSTPHNGAIIQRDPASSGGVAKTNAEVRKVDATADAGPFYKEPEFWVAFGFILFVGLLLYLKVHKAAGAALDARGAKIKSDLDEAARLRAEAEALLGAAEAKLAAAAGDADKIVGQAEREAAALLAQADKDLTQLIARRSQAAADRIAAAERTAAAALKSRTVDMATEQARAALAAQDTAVQTKLVDDAIAGLDRQLH